MPPKDNTATDAAVTMEPGQFNPFANALLGVAKRLQDEKDTLMAQIDANRSGLRSLRTQRLMDDEQSKAVEEFYPTRERKPKDKPAAAASA